MKIISNEVINMKDNVIKRLEEENENIKKEINELKSIVDKLNVIILSNINKEEKDNLDKNDNKNDENMDEIESSPKKNVIKFNHFFLRIFKMIIFLN